MSLKKCESAHSDSINRIVWVVASKDDVKACPAGALCDARFQFSKVQHSEEPDDRKPMMRWLQASARLGYENPQARSASSTSLVLPTLIMCCPFFRKKRSERAQGISN